MHRVSILTVVALAACSGGGTSAPVTPPATPTIGLSLSLASGRAARGSNTSTVATLVRSGGYTGAVTMRATDVPSGVQVTFDPNTLTGTTTTTTVSFIVGPTASGGAAPIGIAASGNGVEDASMTYTLQIPIPGIGVGITSPAPTLSQGAAGTVGISVNGTNGFADTVTLSVTAPSGVTTTLTPAILPPGTNASSLAISVGSNVLPGTYPIVIAARGTGVRDGGITFFLTVTAASRWRAAARTSAIAP